MEVLIAFFGFFVLMSVVALIKFQGNPLFLFSLLLSTASLIWLFNLHRQERSPRSGMSASKSHGTGRHQRAARR